MCTWQSDLPPTQAQPGAGEAAMVRDHIFNANNHAAASPAQFLTLLPPDQSHSGGSKGSAWRQLFPL